MPGAMPLVAVLPGRLYQSGCPVLKGHVKEAGIDAILAVGDSEQAWLTEWKDEWDERFQGPHRPQRAMYAHVPLFDADDCCDPFAATAAIRWGASVLADPGRVLLVHCDAGAFRSVHVTAGILCALLGMSPEAAFVKVDMARGAKQPRLSLGMRGWDEHAAAFPAIAGGRAAVLQAALGVQTRARPAEVPRRAFMPEWVAAEYAIHEARAAVEAMPADMRLTRASVLLGEAQGAVADFVDGVSDES